MRRRGLAAACSIVMVLTTSGAVAQKTSVSDGVIRIGIINDRSGPYADLTGEGSVVAARMAAQEMRGTVLGAPIEIVSADHQNKPDIGGVIARKWFDTDKVDAIADISSSAVGLAVVSLANEREKIVLNASGSSVFTGKACSKTTFQIAYNSFTNAYGLADTVTKTGLDSWFLITVDYAFGHSLAADIRSAVQANGGKVLGEVRHPVNTSDFSSFLLQAQSSGAKVVALANGGSDFSNALKQAAEFRLTASQVVVAPTVFLTDVKALGLATAQGLQFVTAFYWDRDEASRSWSEQFVKKHGSMPTMSQASIYWGVLHYLRAIEAAGTDGGRLVAEKMRERPVDVPFAQGPVRTDGQFVHDMYLVRVKKPAESKSAWDLYEVTKTVPGQHAFLPLERSECPLVK